MNLRLAEIGIALVFTYVLLSWIFIWVSFWHTWVWGLAIVICLGLYIAGRKAFLYRVKNSSMASILLAILGLNSLLIGIVVGFLYAIFRDMGSNQVITPWSWEDAMLLAYSGLQIVLGTLLFGDGIQYKFDRFNTLPSQEIDLESQIRYPEDLLARYAKLYPHNPQGVLEWHIHKKMKQGKTREQAIKELQNHT